MSDAKSEYRFANQYYRIRRRGGVIYQLWLAGVPLNRQTIAAARAAGADWVIAVFEASRRLSPAQLILAEGGCYYSSARIDQLQYRKRIEGK